MPLPQANLRLVGGSNQYEGRVKVYRSGEWQTVCDKSWGIREAEVVCQQLGYEYAVLAIQGATFGERSGGQWYREWSWKGNESSLNDCNSSNTSCSHSEDASVICSGNGKTYRACSVWHLTTHHLTLQRCMNATVSVWWLILYSPLVHAALSNGALRLASTGRTRFGGRLEVYQNNDWGTVCIDLWSSSDATAACRQIGFVSVNDSDSSLFGSGISYQHIWLNTVACSGSES